MESKGNFQCLPSPLRENWKGAVSSMYGYRLDPFDGVVEFDTGIDIARPLGTELVAVFDGTIAETGYDSNYGNYIVLEDEKRHTVLYAHCQRVSVSRNDVVETGQQIGTMGSTGNSTGSHLHFEVRDADGNRLNPYFYLSEEIAAIL
jgi:murein DD-endopeptidase MepM/ murein hydrolase activator NlpD